MRLTTLTCRGGRHLRRAPLEEGGEVLGKREAVAQVPALHDVQRAARHLGSQPRLRGVGAGKRCLLSGVQ